MTGRTRQRGGVIRFFAVLLGTALAIGFAAPAMATGDDDDLFGDRFAKWNKPLDGLVVGLDPGHNGGNAAGTSALRQRVSDGRGGFKVCNTVGSTTASGYAEHEFNFEVSEEMSARLEALGATVVMTREDNDGVGPCVDVRGRFPEDQDVDIFLSVHANGSTDTDINGFFVMVADPPLSASQAEPSWVLAESVVEGMVDAGFEKNSALDEAIIARDDLATLNFARRPAVMVELAEMNNPGDAELIESKEGREAYAEALVRGITIWHNGGPQED